jgi:hypothetical protein
MKLIFLLLISIVAFVSVSCDDDDSSLTGTGTVTIEFDNRIGEEQLELNTEYTNASGEAFSISKLNYYISNVILTTTGGQDFVVPQDSSYFLVSEEVEASQHITLKNIPAGDYNQVSFTIGVDSLRSTMDITRRQGALDPAQGHDGMYWTWNSGYIFFKMEGTSPVAPAEQEHKFYYHIGGYGGYETPSLNNIRERTIDMGSAIAQVRSGKAPQIHIHVDVLELFKNPTLISIAQNPTVMFSDYSRNVSANYVNMFKYDHVHN